MAAAEPRRFSVHPLNAARDASHTVEGEGFEDAALAFIDLWHPPVDATGDVSLMVTDCETGRRECLRVDVDLGQAEPCD